MAEQADAMAWQDAVASSIGLPYHAGGSVQQDVETRIDGNALHPLDEYFRIFRFDSVQLCSIKPPLCGRIGSRHGERLHESLNPDGPILS